MKALVTGSSGHLGEALVRTLRDRGTEVVGVDRLPSPFTSVVGSIVDRNVVDECLRDVDVVFHTATLHKPHVDTHSKQDFVDTNITGTLNLLERALANGIRSFIFTSTTSVFGDAMIPQAGEAAVWVTEDTRPLPKNIYGVTKTVYAARGWKMLDRIGRVYVNAAARRDLGWQPVHDFRSIIARLGDDQDHRSELAIAVGAKGYHHGASDPER